MYLKKMKQLLSLFLCVVMLAGAIPVEAFAAMEKESMETVLQELQKEEIPQAGQHSWQEGLGENKEGLLHQEDTLEESLEESGISVSENIQITALENEVMVPAASEEEGAAEDGSFVLAAFSQNITLIEPVTVSYKAGDSVKEALLASSYRFTGVENGFIGEIEGVGGNYSVVFADGGYLLETPADRITTLFISERTDVNTAANPQLVTAISTALKQMEAFNSADNHVQQFEKAADAYETILTDLRTAGADAITEETKALADAMKEYEDFIAGGKRKVKVNVTQAGQEVKDALLKFTDQYGNVTEASGNEIELRDGTYTFVVTDARAPYNFTTNVGKMNSKTGGSWNFVENYFTVSEESTEVNVKLAGGQWFGEITAEANASTALDSSRTLHDEKNHKSVFYVADSFSGNVKPTFQKGEGTPTSESEETLSSLGIFPWVDFIYVTGDNAGKWVSAVQTSSANTNKASFGSARSCLNVLDKGMEGNTIYADMKWLDDTASDATNYIVMQGYELELKRFPTLTALSVKEGEGAELISSFDTYSYQYEIHTISGNFMVAATPYNENYEVRITAGENTRVEENQVSLTAEKGSFTVVVEAEGVTTEYRINLTKVPAVEVTLSMEEGVTAEVFNASSSKIAPKEPGGKVYSLVPGEAYTYVGTKELHYHTTAEFTAEEALTVQIATPQVKTVVKDFAVYDGSNINNRIAYEWNQPFEENTYQYTWYVPDVKSGNALYVQATGEDSDYTYWIQHRKQTTTASAADQIQDWTKKTISNAVDASKTATSLGAQVVAKAGQSNELRLQVRREEELEDGSKVTYYQEFLFTIARVLTLESLSLTSQAQGTLAFVDGEGNSLKYDRDIPEYYVKVSLDTEKLTLSGVFQNTGNNYSFDGGYYALVQGNKYEDISNITLALAEDKASELIEVKVCHRDTVAVSQTYKIHVAKQEPVKVKFQTTPENALVYLVNLLDNKAVYKDDNHIFTLMPEVPYSLTVSATGYKTYQQEELKISEAEEGEEAVRLLEVHLEKAPETDRQLPDYEAAWPTFRADKNGNGVVASKTPIEGEDAVLYWATKIGEGYDTGATGCPILVDGYLFTYAGKEIVKMDVISGQVVARGEMAAASSFAINSPTYAEGMLFVGLGGGRVQAFNAKTLESLWIYTDPKGGQPNCSIKYHKGYIYTGFWTAENKPANFVCIPVTDEDPSQTTEAKAAAWRYTHNGFYWAGAYTGDDFILVGTDDGENGYSTGHASVLSFDTNTGRLIEEMKLPDVGDLRSDIMYDEYGTGDYYFTTKGGYIYRLQVNGDGTFKNLMSLKLDNYSQNDATPPMSTSTPVIYNGRAYIGVSGEGQFGAYSGHNITVIDLASWSIAYKVRTQGYPQTSGLLTTAYEEETGYVYVYFIDNYTPGKLRILADKPGQKAPLLTTTESGYETAKVLFTPTGKQVQYAICSPIADENGVIYFKNDSAHMMALGPAIEKIEVTKLPDKTEYLEGESFDFSGMVVMATYTNKTQKDITNYISYSKEPLRKEDQEFMITFPYVMYQDKEGQTGVEYPQPMTSVSLKIRSKEIDLSKEFWVEGIEDYDYTGKAVLQQNMVVYHENSELTLGKDYTIKYKNNKKAGTAAVIITGKGNYTGSISKEFQIRPLDLSQAMLAEEVVVLAYNQRVQRAVTEVSYQLSGKNIKLKPGTDFTYEYPETEQGAYQEPDDTEGYKVLLKGKGNYTGEKIFYQKITEKTLLSKLTLSKIPDQKYNEIENPEAGVFPPIILKDKEGKVLSYRIVNETGNEEPQSDTQEYDFTAEYHNHQKVGTATVILKAVEGGKYSGTRTVTFRITGSPLSKAKITDFNKTVEWSEEAYTQEGIKQKIKVEYTLGSGKNKQVMLLEENKDYTVAYSNNKEAGTATLILTGQGGFTGTVKKTFKIKGIPMSKVKAELEQGRVDYQAEAVILNNYKLSYEKSAGTLIELRETGEDGRGDYQVSYKNNQKAGTATIIFQGRNGYTGKLSKTFKINAHDISQGNVSVQAADQVYEKGGVFPKPVVTYEDGGKTVLLTEGIDYTLSYSNNKAAAKKESAAKVPTVIVTGKGGFQGKLTEKFSIEEGNLAAEGITITASDIIYKNKSNLCKPTIAIYDRNGKKLVAGTDYNKEIEYTYAEQTQIENSSIIREAGSKVEKTDIIPQGTRMIAKITGKNNYGQSEVTTEFFYVKGSMKNASVTIAPQTYTGREITLSEDDLEIKIGKETLKPEDYKIVGYSNNKEKGKAKVTIKGIGSYTGEKTVSFRITVRTIKE